MSSFRKVNDQKIPDYLLQKFAMSEVDNIDSDPYAELRAGHGERSAKIANNNRRHASGAAQPKPEWERVTQAEPYERQSVRRASTNMQSADPSTFSSGAIRRVEGGMIEDMSVRSAMRPADMLFMTRMESQMLVEQMQYAGIPTMDPLMEKLADDFTTAERDGVNNRHTSRQDRESFLEADNARKHVRAGNAQKRSLRAERQANSRAGGLLPSTDKVTRASDATPVVGRFAQRMDTHLGMLAERDERRMEEVVNRMERKAAIKGVDHKTQAERSSDWEESVRTHGVNRNETTSFIDRILDRF